MDQDNNPSTSDQLLALRVVPGNGESASRLHVADDIMKSARQHRVRLRQDPLMVEALATYNITDSVPTELYTAAADILTFLQNLEIAGK